jgi:hypothetical protein
VTRSLLIHLSLSVLLCAACTVFALVKRQRPAVVICLGSLLFVAHPLLPGAELASLPLMLLGTIWLLWGKRVAL